MQILHQITGGEKKVIQGANMFFKAQTKMIFPLCERGSDDICCGLLEIVCLFFWFDLHELHIKIDYCAHNHYVFLLQITQIKETATKKWKKIFFFLCDSDFIPFLVLFVYLFFPPLYFVNTVLSQMQWNFILYTLVCTWMTTSVSG